MGYDFVDKTALITGGSSGIGLATAVKLAEKGTHLWLLGRRIEALEQAKAKLDARTRNNGQIVEILAVDVAEMEQVEEAVEKINQKTGVPDILVNSAGITYPGYFENLDLKTIRNLMEINYFGTVNTVKAVLPGMLERGSGSIVNLASLAVFFSLPGYTAYGASKFAVRGFSESLRTEVKRKGIHVAVVCPPDTDTPQLENELPIRPAEVNLIAQLDKVISPDEVAEAVVKGIARKRFLIIPGFNSQFLYWLQSLTGSLAYSIIDQVVKYAIQKTSNKNLSP